MAFTLPDLLDTLDLRPDGEHGFLATSPEAGWRRLFGGLVLAQALRAMEATAQGRTAHAMHALFLRAGDPVLPTRYGVSLLRDGRSFSARQCVAEQDGAAILTAFASFQVDEGGLDHRSAMPVVPMPEALPSLTEVVSRLGPAVPPPLRTYLARDSVIELRPTNLARLAGEAVSGALSIWMRAAGPLPDDPGLHRAMIAYMSDMTLLDAALAPHGGSVFHPSIQAASLDHALWFHRPGRADQWMLYVQDSPSAGGARGFARGSLFARDGTLLASMAQEGLIRQR